MNPLRSNLQNPAFGLVAWLEKTRVALPLKGVECRFHVGGTITCVEIDQIYHQNADRPLDCTYTFPLPSGAAVYRCELHVNGRVICAKVEEKEKAGQIYREKKAVGRRAALVESERENLFTLSLGNVQPGDLIVVCFAWFQVLDRIGEGLRLMVPTCPGVRYIPGEPLLRGLSGRGTFDDTDQVPDASRITPPRIDALHPDAAYLSIKGQLFSSAVESGTVTSPSHPVFVRDAGSQMRVELFGRNAVPDRDFVLVWQEPKAKQLITQAWRWSQAGETYALVRLRAPEVVAASDEFSQDFYFLVDRSGSMEGPKWRCTCEALRAFVGLLGSEDRVAITLFASDFRDFAEAPVPAPKVSADGGFQRMATMGTGGGTELLPAALHVLEQIAFHSKGRRTTVVLITDGQIGNESAVLSAFKGVPTITVHTFGIDTAVNDAFLKTLSHQQRGGCWLQTPDEDIAQTIASLAYRLRRPVLTDLSITGAWETGRQSLPDLHVGEVVTVTLRGSESGPLEFSGMLPDGRRHSFAADLGPKGSEAIKLLWAKERISALLSSGRRQEAIACAKLHNLICEGAAFIAWDEAEQVQIAEDEVVQPAMAPPALSVLYSMSGPVKIKSGQIAFSRSVENSERTLRSTDRESNERRLTKLGEILQQERMPKDNAEEFIVWVREDATEGRMVALERAAAFLASYRKAVGKWVGPILLEKLVCQGIGKSPNVFVDWAEEMEGPFQRLVDLGQELSAEGTPDVVFAHLVVWVFDAGGLDQDRLGVIEKFVESLKHLPFSAASKASRWKSFLESTYCRSSSWIAARDWASAIDRAPTVGE